MGTTLNKFKCLALSILLLGLSCSKDERQVKELAFSSLLPSLENTDEVFGCHQAKPLFYKISSNKVKELFRTLKVENYKQGFSCMCDAELVFYFYQNSKLLFVLGIHTDKSIRKFKSSWSGDAVLSDASKEYLDDWLRRNFVGLDALKSGAFTPPDLE